MSSITERLIAHLKNPVYGTGDEQWCPVSPQLLRDAESEICSLKGRLAGKTAAYQTACLERTAIRNKEREALNENADLRARNAELLQERNDLQAQHSPCQADVDRLQFRLDAAHKDVRKFSGMYRIAAEDRRQLQLRLNEAEEALSGYRRDWAETSDQLQAERERTQALSEANGRQAETIGRLQDQKTKLCADITRYSAYMRALMDQANKPDDYSADVVDAEHAHGIILAEIKRLQNLAIVRTNEELHREVSRVQDRLDRRRKICEEQRERSENLKEQLVDANARLREIGGLVGGAQ